MRFGDVVAGHDAEPAFGYRPDYAQIDWAKVESLKSGTSGRARLRQVAGRGTGLKHKDVIRFRTPGLTGIKGSCS